MATRVNNRLKMIFVTSIAVFLLWKGYKAMWRLTSGRPGIAVNPRYGKYGNQPIIRNPLTDFRSNDAEINKVYLFIRSMSYIDAPRELTALQYTE